MLPADYFDLKIYDGDGLLEFEKCKLPRKPIYYINQFKKYFSNDQPYFIISRSDFEALTSTQIFPAIQHASFFEVYALVFCYGYELKFRKPGNLFFRIRKIIYNPKTDKNKLYYQDDNIAYADLSIAYSNMTLPKSKRQSCIKFLFPTLLDQKKAEIRAIDDRIQQFKDDLALNPLIQSGKLKLPEGKINDIGQEMPIQEGNIFGANRIMNELLNGKYSDDNRKKNNLKPINQVEVHFAYNKKTSHIFFIFNINGTYATEGIVCPGPPVCR